MRSRLTTRIAAVSAAILILAGSVGCGGGSSDSGAKKPAGAVIKIGHFASMTGGQANFGQSADKGARLAIDEINKAGGVLGKQIELITEDDRSQSTEARTAALKLIQQDHVVALIGEVASSNSIAAAPEAQKAHIPMVSPASTNPEVTQKGEYIFRICFIDPFQGEAMANFAFTSLGKRTAAVFTDVKSAYAVGLGKYFKETFAAKGGKVVSEEAYSLGDTDFKAQLTKIRQSNPEVLFIPGYYSEVGLIARQARELGITAILMGGDGWDSPKTIEVGGAAVEGAYYSNHYATDDPNPVVQTFVTTYRSRYNELADGMAALGYDAAKIVADAITRAGSTDGAKIRDALAATRDFQGVSGGISIDENRNAKKSLTVLKIENGALHFAERVNP